MSPFAARDAESMGYTNVKVFHAGMPEWKKANGLIISEPGYLKGLIEKDMSYVLIDLRPVKDAESGFIKGAVSIPSDRIAASKDMFPADKNAPVILYTAETADEAAFNAVRSWGYKNANVMRGGAKAWAAMGGAFEKGALAASIDYVKKIPRSEVGIAEFKSVISSMPGDKIILDVRDMDTASKGKIPGAVHIPKDELASRLGELSKDKEILIHCNTGMLASMAHETLAKNGYRARFLNAVVQVDSDGKADITEK